MHRRLAVTVETPRPAYVVWELTLRCDQPCTHCGSRAGEARPDELSREEALDVAAQLARAGTDEVALIGGEAYLHPHHLEIIAALRAAGVRTTMTTGGRGVDAARARALARAGLQLVSVSLDGLEATHDLMRAGRGSFAAATAAARHLRDAGIPIAANTNVNRLNAADLEPLYDVLKQLGVGSWQVQLTAPLGRAADRPDLILQPFDLPALLPRIAALKRRAYRDGILVMPGNNLGYFGPEEALLRSRTPDGRDHFQGCQAGRFVLGIESDGTVKGCPSLQTAEYAAGSLRREPLEVLWREATALGFTRHRTTLQLWGFCRECPFAASCMGGCTFTAHAILGRPGNNPYCHFRAMEHQRRGLRERLVPRRGAPGLPFDNGAFDLVVEPAELPVPEVPEPRRLVQVRRPGRDA